MEDKKESEKLEEQAARIARAEEEAGIKGAKPDEETIAYRATARGYRISTDFVFTILACVFIGWVADEFLGSWPWGLLVMLVIGFIIGMTNLWRAVATETENNKKESEKKD